MVEDTEVSSKFVQTVFSSIFDEATNNVPQKKSFADLAREALLYKGSYDENRL
jgi:hypothetical protein